MDETLRLVVGDAARGLVYVGGGVREDAAPKDLDVVHEGETRLGSRE
jgi:hypothetical protein